MKTLRKIDVLRTGLLPLAVASLTAGAAFAAPPSTAPAPPATSTASPAPAASPFVVHQAVLFQPDELLKERFGGDGLIASFYLKQLETEAKKYFATLPRGEGATGVVIATARPGSSAKIWFAFPATKRLALDVRVALEKKLAAVPAPIPTGGPVALGLAFSVWGGDRESQEMMRQGPPVPDAWRIVMMRSKKPGMPFDEMLNLAWPK